MGNRMMAQGRNTQSSIYHMVYRAGPLARPEIGRRLGVSLPTVMQGVKELVDKGLLEEGAPLASTGGRKAVGIQCVDDARVALGVDITKNHVSMVVVDLKGQVLAQQRVVLPFAAAPAYWGKVGRLATELRDEAAVPQDRYLGVGVSIPGVVSQDGQTLLYSHVLQESALEAGDVAQELGYPCLLCNDANAAGNAEMWGEESAQTALYLSLSNSVGGAIVVDGKPFWGQRGRCGEFGHTTLVPGGKTCYCGHEGCLDAYCNATLLSRHTGGDLHLFFELLQQKNSTLAAVWSEYLEFLSVAVNNMITAYDSPLILGGYLGEYIEPYLPRLRAMVAQRTTFAGNENGIRACRHKTAAAAVGAALLRVSPFLESI